MYLPLYLLGDSIFDNGAYAKSPVLFYLKQEMEAWGDGLPNPHCLAVDGHCATDVYCQMKKLPSHPGQCDVVLSVGGNDALGMAESLLSSPCDNVHGALETVYRYIDPWRSDYAELVMKLKKTARRLTLCTIYRPYVIGMAESLGLSLFNDHIIQTAVDQEANLIDLRSICHDRNDFSPVSPIEPSDIGGKKIAQAIMRSYVGPKRNQAITVIH